jgi:hypothetical protein
MTLIDDNPPERPHRADPTLLTSACLLLCVIDTHKWTWWDRLAAIGAVINIVYYVFRLVRMRQWENRREAWEAAHRAHCPICSGIQR